MSCSQTLLNAILHCLKSFFLLCIMMYLFLLGGGGGAIRKTEMWTLKGVQCWCGSCSGWTASQCTSRHRKRKKKGGRGRERGRTDKNLCSAEGELSSRNKEPRGTTKRREMGWERRKEKTFKTTKHYWLSRADSGWMPALNVISESEEKNKKAIHT